MKKKAVALAYNSNENAPRLVAKGFNEVAERIIKLARSNGVPVKFDTLLVETLIQLDIGEYIPEELYEIIAEVIAFVYRTKMER